MNVPSLLPLTFALALSAASAFAQQPPAASDATPTASASVSRDCRKPMAGHDHLADKGIIRPQSGPCAGKRAASGARTPAKPVHDHAKFHKNQ